MMDTYYYNPQTQPQTPQASAATQALSGQEAATATSPQASKPRQSKSPKKAVKKEKIHGRFGYYDGGVFHKYTPAQQHYMDSLFAKLAPGQKLGADVTLEQLQAQQAQEAQIRNAFRHHKYEMPILWKGSFFEKNPFYTAKIQPGLPGKDAPLRSYSLHSDVYVTGIIFLCLFMLAYVLTAGRSFIFQKVKYLLRERGRQSLFDAENRTGLHYRFFLFLQVCFVLGLLFFDYVQDYMPEVFENASPYVLLGVDVGVFMVFYAMKGLVYSFVNWVFFNPDANKRWMDVYFFVKYLSGVLLFPLVLLMVYFNLPPDKIAIYAIVVALLNLIVLFYKCFSIFFKKSYGFLSLIVYFCTLEIVPALILWKVLVVINEYLV